MQEQLFTTILSGGSAGIIAALLLVIVLLVREDLVPGRAHKKLEAKLTRFEELAYKAMTLAERASKDGAG